MHPTKAIPDGYMTVGEVAKKMDITVRTLQYYDKEGVLKPSAESEGGRRLYSDKDIVKLHRILSMKYLGFSLDEIKHKIVSLDTPAEVAAMLAGQAEHLRNQIGALTDALDATERLKEEVTQMQTVDFRKYADIVFNLQMKNENYRLLKHLDEETADRLRHRFNKESAEAVIVSLNHLSQTAAALHDAGVSPTGEKGQQFAKEYWDKMMEITGRDVALLAKLEQLSEKEETAFESAVGSLFIEPALEEYFKNNPKEYPT